MCRVAPLVESSRTEAVPVIGSVGTDRPCAMTAPHDAHRWDRVRGQVRLRHNCPGVTAAEPVGVDLRDAAIEAAAKAKYERRKRFNSDWSSWERLPDANKASYYQRVERSVSDALAAVLPLARAQVAEEIAAAIEAEWMVEAIGGGITDSDVIWPSEVARFVRRLAVPKQDAQKP